MNLFKSSVLCGMVIVSFMTSCTDVDITMPKGPKGDTGLSAYEFWKEKVADGTVNWPKDQTEVADFFKFLKGKDGKDGKDGQSAFEQWKDMIASGSVDDPHNPGEKWPSENNTVQDFWRFLTGASGEDGHRWARSTRDSSARSRTSWRRSPRCPTPSRRTPISSGASAPASASPSTRSRDTAVRRS